MVSKSRATPLLACTDGYLEGCSQYVAGQKTQGAYVVLFRLGGIKDASCAQLLLSSGGRCCKMRKLMKEE
jgi:hypothetical protein